MDLTIPRTASADPYPLLIKQLLHTPMVCSGEQEIVYRDRVRLSYRSFRDRVGRLASALAAMGVKPGDTVAVADWDSHRYLEAYFAVPMMGAVLHHINVRLSPEQVLYTMNHAEDRVVLVHRDFVPLMTALRERLSTVERFVFMADGDAPDGVPEGFDGEYEELLAAADPDYEFPDLDENTRATTFYTTGTTGLPKGVYFSHRQLVLHTLGLIAGLSTPALHARVHNGDVYMPLTPMFHVHAWGVPYMMTLLGVKQVYPGRYEPEMIGRLLATEGITISHCVPTILQMLVSSPAVQQLDLTGWKVIIGGSALTTSLAKAALDLGIDVITGYGMSETCPLLSLSHMTADMADWSEEEQLRIRTSTGRPVPLVDLHLWDEEGNELPRDGKTRGEIVARAPWMTQGYFKNPEASEALWRGGYLHTGDIATQDERGYLKIVDRLKDVIKTGGEWVSSLDLEEIIVAHPSVSEAAVVGVPDPRWGERPVAFVVPAPGAGQGPDEETIKGHVAEYAEKGIIPKYGIPDRVLVVEELPRTSVGKLDKKELRNRLA